MWSVSCLKAQCMLLVEQFELDRTGRSMISRGAQAGSSYITYAERNFEPLTKAVFGRATMSRRGEDLDG